MIQVNFEISFEFVNNYKDVRHYDIFRNGDWIGRSFANCFVIDGKEDDKHSYSVQPVNQVLMRNRLENESVIII